MDKKVALGFFPTGHAFYYCEGPEPCYGASYCKINGEAGEIGYWPVFSAPPAQLHGVLIQEATSSPETGEEATQ